MKQKYFTFLCFNFIFITITFSQIVNEGTLQIDPSIIVYFGDEYTNKSAAIHNNDGDLYLNNNSTNNGITTLIAGTTSFKSLVNTVQTISRTTNSVNFYNLETDNALMGVSVVDVFELNIVNAVILTARNICLVGEVQLV